MQTIEKKINGLGLAESTVQQRGRAEADSEILVQLPGVDDPARVKQILQTAAMLELYEVKDGPFSSPGRGACQARRRSAAEHADSADGRPRRRGESGESYYPGESQPGGYRPRSPRCARRPATR